MRNLYVSGTHFFIASAASFAGSRDGYAGGFRFFVSRLRFFHRSS